MSDERAQNVVTLGAHDYIVVPQPHAIILRKIPKVMQDAQSVGEDLDLEGQAIVDVLGDRAHSVLKIFIPDLMPAHEFAGFSSKEAKEGGDFEEEFARTHAPTIPDIMRAFDVAIAVNGGKRLQNMLGKVLGPDVFRALRSFVVLKMKERLSEMSLNSQPPSGGSVQTSSGLSSPTMEAQENEG